MSTRLRPLVTILRRELLGIFATPVAWVFLVIFLGLAGALPFYLGAWFQRNIADLQPFFGFLPWLFLFLVPALAMRMWAEERQTGTVELLLTLPISIWQAVLGKFLAGWLFLGLALLLTFPLWLTVSYLGAPDHGVILAGYLGSWLMAGAFLAVGCCLSAITRSQVVAFILTLVVCFVLLLLGHPGFNDLLVGWAPRALVETLTGLSVLDHFSRWSRGLIEFRSLFYFFTMMAAWLLANALILQRGKSR